MLCLHSKEIRKFFSEAVKMGLNSQTEFNSKVGVFQMEKGGGAAIREGRTAYANTGRNKEHGVFHLGAAATYRVCTVMRKVAWKVGQDRLVKNLADHTKDLEL